MTEIEDRLLRKAGRALYFSVPLVLAGVEFGGYYALFGDELMPELVVSVPCNFERWWKRSTGWGRVWSGSELRYFFVFDSHDAGTGSC